MLFQFVRRSAGGNKIHFIKIKAVSYTHLDVYKRQERTRLLVHLIDTSDATDADPIQSYGVVAGELSSFSALLAEKPVIVAATKLDATTDRTRLDSLREFCQQQGLEFHAISAPTGEGVRELVRAIADALDKIPRAPDSALDLADDSTEDISDAPQPSREAH